MYKFDLHILEPAEFESLVADLVTARENAIDLSTYIVITQNAGPDGGVDFKFDEGKVIGQAKRYKNKHKLFNDLKKEVEKVKRLSPERYILIVSLDIDYKFREKIKKLFHPHIQRDSDIIDRTDISRLLDVHGDILLRHNKLWLPSTHILQQVVENSVTKSFRDFTSLIKEELGEAIGKENIDKLPELQELFQKVEFLEGQISQTKKELEDYRKALDSSSGHSILSEMLTKACQKIQQEYEDLRLTLTKTKQTIEKLTQHIKRQKDFLDKMDQHEVSERMGKARILFEEGNFVLANELLNYEGREKYICKKLEEKESQSVEWANLANEEAFIALTLLQEKEWRENILKIDTHFKQSIELGGYGQNAYQYSFFLEEIDQPEHAINILKKTISQLPTNDVEVRALVWARLGILSYFINQEEALNAYGEAVTLFELLFEHGRTAKYRVPLADAAYRYGTLLVDKSLDEARKYLEQALMLTCNLERGNYRTLLLTFLILNTLVYLHQQLHDDKQSGSYLIIALETGGMLAVENPDDGVQFLLEAVNRLEKFCGAEEDIESTALFYRRALNYFLTFHKELSLEENHHYASQLVSIGLRLLAAQETTGAEICFKEAIGIFRKVEKGGYSCPAAIADALSLVGFIYMTRNNVKARKKVLLDALNIRRKLADTNPVEHLPQVASLLDELYTNSFIAVSSAQYHKANPFFEEALAIHKRLDKEYKQPDISGWKHLLQHKATMLSQKLDKTDTIIFYHELLSLRNRMAILQPNSDDEWFQSSIHELGELLLKNLPMDHPLSSSIIQEIIVVRTNLFEKDPEKYRGYLALTLSEAGQKLLEGSQKEKACAYLQRAVILLKELIACEPSVYEKALVMPMFQLAYSYTLLDDYASAVPYFIDLCDYFENRLDENPEYLTMLVSFMLSTTEALIYDKQKEKALAYIAKAQAYIPDIADDEERTRLKESFKKLKSKL